MAHPFTQAFVEAFASLHYLRERSIQAALQHAESLLELARQQSYGFWIATATVCQGTCLARMGRSQEGIETLTQGLANFARMGTKNCGAFLMSGLAESHVAAGRTEDGLDILGEAFAHVKETGERHWEAELYRLRGEFLLLSGGSESEVEECFNQAIEIARSQSAKSLELRASLSLARFWQNKGKKSEARELLAGINGWFTEGFDTPDLIDAKALLEELS